MSQLEILPFYNQGLFSNNYLEHHLPQTTIWSKSEVQIKYTRKEISLAYKNIKGLNLGPEEEASLEEKLIRPVLKILGYELDIQPTTQRGAKKKRPDYALFRDKASLEEARSNNVGAYGHTPLQQFFSHPLTILEAKYWGRHLNDADTKDKLDVRDPTAQTVKYLDDVYHASEGRIQWAILTNGKVWRLFYYRASSRSGNFYDIDLEAVLQSGNIDDFKYFYLFFSKDAFLTDPATGKTWLDQHLKGSEDYAARVSAELKDLIFDKVFEGLATGFIEYRRNELGIKNETEEGLKDVFKGCLTLLYRLLFLLYAESRGLLPVDDQSRYYKKSLKKLKENIVKDISTTGIEGMSRNAYDYWSSLESLCRIIDKGDKALNVPIYNGGLFETLPESFLSENKISDPYLAEAIQLLTIEKATSHEGPRFIDYSSLGVRHLGDIYEGLLEFHVRIAEEEMVEVREKSKSLWKRLSEIKDGTKTYRRKANSDVYIENLKHERRATGSYYTPHYIVEYIVKNTVGPVVEEKFKRAEEILSELNDLYEKQRKQLKKPDEWKHWEHPGEPKGELIEEILKKENSVSETVFDIKVLDPAMGSGHFLVHAVDYISDRIITFLADYPENPVIRRIEDIKKEILDDVTRQGVTLVGAYGHTPLTEVNLIKRTVMKRCIYGVDLNEMAVELAKLSLWLDSFTLGAPLSFLDHHLKWGNSLIGTTLEALEKTTEGQLFAVPMEPLKRAIRDMLFVAGISDATYQQVKDSAKKYNEADTSVEGYRILLDILVSEYFGTKDAKRFLLDQGVRIDVNNLKKSLASMFAKDRKVIEAIEGIAKEKRFFHWEIEFPEVFYKRNGGMEQKIEKKKNPGFDCVIGNPPWGAAFSFEEKAYLIEKFNNVHLRATESANYFIGLSSFIARTEGLVGYIVPNIILYQHEFRKTREALLKENVLQSVLNLGNGVFEDVTAPCCIMVWLCGTKLDTPFDRFYYQDFRSVSKDILESDFNASLKPCQFAASDILKVEGAVFQADTASLSIIAKATTVSVKLGDISSEVASGIGTGGDNVYRLPNQKILAGRLEKDTIHPVLVGGDIYPYFVPEDSGHSILYITKDFDPKNHPKTYSYLLPYKEKLSQKREAKKGLILWYSLHWPRNPDLFKAPKIVCRQTADTLVAAVDEKGYYVLNSIIVIQISETKYNLKFITTLLNSKILRFIYRNLTQEEDRVFAEVKPINLRKLPIPRIAFKTPEKKRKKKVSEAIALYEDYMLEFGKDMKGVAHGETTSIKRNERVANFDSGREEEIPGEHTGSSGLFYGLRGVEGEQEDAGRVSEGTCQYNLPIDFKKSRPKK